MFDSGDGTEPQPRLLGFETDDIQSLEQEIHRTVQDYVANLDRIERKLQKIYAKNLPKDDENKEVHLIRNAPYMIKHKSYELWAGDFIAYRWTGAGIARSFLMPHIIPLDDWFGLISSRRNNVH